MRRSLLLAALAAVLLNSSWALPLPDPVELGHILGTRFPAGAPPRDVQDQLFILGWSPANVIAILYRSEETAGLFRLRLELVDLVEDVTVFRREWDSWSADQVPEEWWNGHSAELDPVWQEFRIEPASQQLGMFPLILDNEYYTLSLRMEHSVLDPARITQLQVWTRSTGRGMKNVLDLEGRWRWATIAGFLPSPFQNRLALVLLVQPEGWAGRQQPVRFLVTGMSLKAGFPVP